MYAYCGMLIIKKLGLLNLEMKDKIETLEERYNALMRAEQNRKAVIRRRRINLCKNLIVIIICLISMAPTCLSAYLMYQVTGMEQQISYLAGQREAEDSVNLAEVAETDGNNVSAAGDKSSDNGDISGSVKKVKPGKRVYLTFDDGPSENTSEILDILNKHNVKATFFVVGKTDEDSMNNYREIVNQGHGIGIHSYTHKYDEIYSSLSAFQTDVNSMSDLIYAATGVRTHMYRFPGGSSNSVSKTSVKELANWLTEEGYVYYDWNALNGDAVTKDLSPDTLVDNIMGSVENNEKAGRDSTVLMHDLTNKHNTVESLEPLIEKLKSKGFAMDKALSEDVNPVQQKVWR